MEAMPKFTVTCVSIGNQELRQINLRILISKRRQTSFQEDRSLCEGRESISSACWFLCKERAVPSFDVENMGTCMRYKLRAYISVPRSGQKWLRFPLAHETCCFEKKPWGLHNKNCRKTRKAKAFFPVSETGTSSILQWAPPRQMNADFWLILL